MLIRNVGVLVYVLEDGYFFLCVNLIAIIGLFVLISFLHAQQVFLIARHCLSYGKQRSRVHDHCCASFFKRLTISLDFCCTSGSECSVHSAGVSVTGGEAHGRYSGCVRHSVRMRQNGFHRWWKYQVVSRDHVTYRQMGWNHCLKTHQLMLPFSKSSQGGLRRANTRTFLFLSETIPLTLPDPLHLLALKCFLRVESFRSAGKWLCDSVWHSFWRVIQQH